MLSKIRKNNSHIKEAIAQNRFERGLVSIYSLDTLEVLEAQQAYGIMLPRPNLNDTGINMSVCILLFKRFIFSKLHAM